jgi:hypothetical protein
VKRQILALLALALLAACGGEAPTGDGRSASGEVLEGTISDAMLPVDRVRSEPPLEDPEAFARARDAADGAEAVEGAGDAAGDDSAEDGQPAADGIPDTSEPAPEAADE